MVTDEDRFSELNATFQISRRRGARNNDLDAASPFHIRRRRLSTSARAAAITLNCVPEGPDRASAPDWPLRGDSPAQRSAVAAGYALQNKVEDKLKEKLGDVGPRLPSRAPGTQAQATFEGEPLKGLFKRATREM